MHKNLCDMYAICIIQKSEVFNVSVLLENADMQMICRFGFQSGRNVQKFQDLAAMFACSVEKISDVGTRIISIGEVIEVKVLKQGPALT